jgi:predicted nucleic acid-binding protein
MLQVLLDTNALHGDRYAERPVATAAWNGAAAGDFQLVVPEVVVQELAKHFPADLRDAVDAVNTALVKQHKTLSAMGLRAPDEMKIDVAVVAGDYERRLRDRCTADGCRVEPTPDLRPADTWAVHRRKPFKDDGHGLPDAAIWLTALELAADHEVVVVTNNSDDFGDGAGGLHTELRGDMSIRGIPRDRIRLIRDLFDLQRAIVEPAAEATARAERLLSDATSGARLKRAVEQNLRGQPVDPGDIGLWVDLDEAPAIISTELDPLRLLDVRETEDGNLLCRIQTTGDFTVTLDVFRSDYVDAEESGVRMPAFDPDHNYVEGEYSFAGSVVAELFFDVRLTGVFTEIDSVVGLSQEEEAQRALDQGGASALLVQLQDYVAELPALLDYLPEEPLRSSIDSVEIGTLRPEQVELEEVFHGDSSDWTASLIVRAAADVTWVVSAPDAHDLADFASLAINAEDGLGVLQGSGDNEPVILRLSGRLSGSEWSDITVDTVALHPDVAARRRDDRPS